MNIMIALIPAISWGLQPLFAKWLGGRLSNQILGVGMGAMIVGSGVYLSISPEKISFGSFMLSLLSGLFFLIGQLGQLRALKMIGVTQMMLISVASQLIISDLSQLIFNGFNGVSGLILVLVSILMMGAIFILAFKDLKSTRNKFLQALVIILFSSISFNLYFSISNVINTGNFSFYFPQMVGVFISAIVYVLLTNPKSFVQKKSWYNVIIGLLISVSTIGYLFLDKLYDQKINYLISAVAVVTTMMGGMIVFHEVEQRRLKYFLLSGGLFALGSILLSLY